MKKTDVVVVGAGPAGCAAAIVLARRGSRVVLLERAALPQHKTCGDCLLPDALRQLEALGVGAGVRGEGLALSRLAVTAPGGRTVSLALPSITLPRPRLHALLQEEARRAGVELLGAEAVAPLLSGERVAGVLLRREGRPAEPLAAPLVILASGARPGTLRDFGVCLREEPSAVGIRAYFRDPSGEFGETLRVSYQRNLLPGYGWVFPQPDGIYNIGCGWFFNRRGEPQPDLSRLFEHFLCTFLPARAISLLEDRLGTPCGGLLRTGLGGALSHRAGLLVTGDALGAALPYTGEGVGKALATGMLAANTASEALQAGDFSAQFLARYGAELETRLRPLYRGYERAQRWLASPRLADLLAWRAQGNPAVADLYAGVLAEEVPPGAAFSLGSLLGWRRPRRPAGATA
jgi:flavin-dependent dehydrogenase